MGNNTSVVVIDILSEVLDIDSDDLEPDTDLTERGWDSMSSLEALARLENHFGGKFDLRVFTAVRTPNDIVAMVGS